MSLGESFGDLWNNTKESVMQKTGLGKLSASIDRLRGKKPGEPPVPDFQGSYFLGENDFRATLKIPYQYVQSYSVSSATASPGWFNGIVFPYTPVITQDYQAVYTTMNPTHSNYSLYFYKHSTPSAINVSGKWSVQNQDDAYYWLACVHLLRALTKMKFGNDPDAGAPPPVCRFSAYGEMQYKNVPVVIQSFKVDLPDNVDYITTSMDVIDGIPKGTAVPVSSTITLNLLPMYSRNELLDQTDGQVTEYLRGMNNSRNRGFL
jgi:hypothetical protein